MNKTLKINISGIVFQIEEDAFETLRNYLQALNNRFKNVPGGNETVEDIESRIAEIFQSQKGLAGIITKENIDYMIGTIGKPEDFGEGEEQKVPPPYSTTARRLYRNPDDTIISGVCGGLGAYLNTDAVWIRLLFVLFTFFFGSGLLIYMVLWIALPNAVTQNQKKELFGSQYNSAYTQSGAYGMEGTTYMGNSAGNVFNEIFRAVGKCIVVAVRIVLIIIGIAFVLVGFLTLLSLIVVLFFRYPGFIHSEAFNANMLYLPDYINYFFTPALTPWVTILICLTIILPLVAIIYWGIKMIFQFRAKDGILSLVLFLIWIASLVLLSAIMFNRGLGFSENGRKSEKTIIGNFPDTLYLKVGNTLPASRYDREITFPGGDIRLALNRSTGDLFIQPEIDFEIADDKVLNIEVTRTSQGHSKEEALRKAESMLFNYSISNDTIYADDYFEVPGSYKWTGGFIEMNIRVPEGVIICTDSESDKFLNPYYNSYNEEAENSDNTYWRMTDDGLFQIENEDSYRQ